MPRPKLPCAVWVSIHLAALLPLGCASARTTPAPPNAPVAPPRPSPTPTSRLGHLCVTVADCGAGMSCAVNGIGERRCVTPAEADREWSSSSATSVSCRSDWQCDWDRFCTATVGGDTRCARTSERQPRRSADGAPRPAGGMGCPHRTQISRCAQQWTLDGECASWSCGPDPRPHDNVLQSPR